MPTARGSRSVINWLPETTYGVAPTGNWNSLTYQSETIGENIAPIISTEIRRDRTVPSVRGGNVTTDGNIVTDFSPTRFGTWFAHLLGATPTTTTITAATLAVTTAYLRGDVVVNGLNDYICVTGGTSDGSALTLIVQTDNSIVFTGTASFKFFGLHSVVKKKHVFTPGLDFFTNGIAVEKGVVGGSSDSYWGFQGGRIDSLALAIPQNGIINATWGWGFVNQPSNASASIAGTPVVLAEDPFTGADVAIEINNAYDANLQQGSLSIQNNTDKTAFRMGSRYRVDANPARREISGSFTAYWTDHVKYDLFRSENIFDIFFSMILGQEFLSIDLPENKFMGDANPKIGGAGNIMDTFGFNTFHQNGSYDIQITLKNTTTSYTT